MTRARRALGQAQGTVLTIRRGTRRDADVIAALIRGLATYERLRRQCVIDPRAVARDGFGRRRYFETLICRRGRMPIGFALYYFTYSTFRARPTLYLEDLFVIPPERGRGAGLALLRALARVAQAQRCARMEWTVLDWNTRAIRFYETLGAELRREWILTRITGPALRRLARKGADGRGQGRLGNRAEERRRVRATDRRGRRTALTAAGLRPTALPLSRTRRGGSRRG